MPKAADVVRAVARSPDAANLDRTGEVLLDQEVQYFGESHSGVGATAETLRELLKVSAGVVAPASPAPVADESSPVAECHVVDGVGFAEHGRDTPSYAQLVDVLDALAKGFPMAEIHTVVPPMSPYLFSSDERASVAAALEAGEFHEAPPGAEGGHHPLLLSLASEKSAVVVSNKDYGQFTGEHPWLAETNRVLGLTEAGGVWIFTPRRAI